jgi:hypothetical protein
MPLVHSRHEYSISSTFDETIPVERKKMVGGKKEKKKERKGISESYSFHVLGYRLDHFF